jgi:hypothetical protein
VSSRDRPTGTPAGILRMLSLLRAASLTSCFAQADAASTADELAPLPGPVLLADGGPTTQAVRDAFVDLAGSGLARIVVLTGDGGPGKELGWIAAGARASVVVSQKRPDELMAAVTIEALLRADGIWIASSPAPILDAPLLRTVLTNALQRAPATR